MQPVIIPQLIDKVNNNNLEVRRKSFLHHHNGASNHNVLLVQATHHDSSAGTASAGSVINRPHLPPVKEPSSSSLRSPHDPSFGAKKLSTKREMEHMAIYAAIIKAGGNLTPNAVRALEQLEQQKSMNTSSSSSSSSESNSLSRPASSRQLPLNKHESARQLLQHSMSRKILERDISTRSRHLFQGDFGAGDESRSGTNASRMSSMTESTVKTITDPSKWNDSAFALKKKSRKLLNNEIVLFASLAKATKKRNDKEDDDNDDDNHPNNEEEVEIGNLIDDEDKIGHGVNFNYRRESDFFEDDFKDSSFDNPISATKLRRESRFAPVLEDQSSEFSTSHHPDTDAFLLERELRLIDMEFDERIEFKLKIRRMTRIFLQWQSLKYVKALEQRLGSSLSAASSKKKSKSIVGDVITAKRWLEVEPRVAPRPMRQKPGSKSVDSPSPIVSPKKMLKSLSGELSEQEEISTSLPSVSPNNRNSGQEDRPASRFTRSGKSKGSTTNKTRQVSYTLNEEEVLGSIKRREKSIFEFGFDDLHIFARDSSSSSTSNMPISKLSTATAVSEYSARSRTGSKSSRYSSAVGLLRKFFGL